MAERGSLTLVLGGARSGKSTFAEQLATAWAGQAAANAAGAAPPPSGAGRVTPSASPPAGRVTYLATAQALDDEMRQRVARHQADRPGGWTTVECPLEVPAAVREHAAGTDVFLLDCVTFWVTNLLFAEGAGGEQRPAGLGDFTKDFIPAEVERAAGLRVERELDALFAALHDTGATLIAVSNEVGLGLVPEYPLSRLYRDELGRANHRLAAAAARAYLLVAGLPLDLKALAAPPPDAAASPDPPASSSSALLPPNRPSDEEPQP